MEIIIESIMKKIVNNAEEIFGKKLKKCLKWYGKKNEWSCGMKIKNWKNSWKKINSTFCKKFLKEYIFLLFDFSYDCFEDKLSILLKIFSRTFLFFFLRIFQKASFSFGVTVLRKIYVLKTLLEKIS